MASPVALVVGFVTFGIALAERFVRAKLEAYRLSNGLLPIGAGVVGGGVVVPAAGSAILLVETISSSYQVYATG